MRNGRERKSHNHSVDNNGYIPETFEVISYRDSIKIVDCEPLFRKLHLHCGTDCQLWIVKDVCGIICVVLTWFLIIFAECVVCCVLFHNFSESMHTAVNGTIFQCLTFLAAISHLKCMFVDPGAIQRGNATRENIVKMHLHDGEIIYRCPKCVCIKPDRAHHCRVCRRCIRKMDHHCPWVNNCIGENNQKYFILFTMYTCVISCHALYMSVYQLIMWTANNWIEFAGASPVASVILLSLLIFEAVIFGIFTAVMFGSQMWAVCTDETYIEHLKKESRQRLSRWLAIKTVFGHPFSYRWFSPFHAGPVAPPMADATEEPSYSNGSSNQPLEPNDETDNIQFY